MCHTPHNRLHPTIRSINRPTARPPANSPLDRTHSPRLFDRKTLLSSTLHLRPDHTETPSLRPQHHISGAPYRLLHSRSAASLPPRKQSPNTAHPAPHTGYCIAAARHPCPRKQSPNTAHPAPRTGYCIAATRHPCPRKQSPNTAHPAPRTGYCVSAARHPCPRKQSPNTAHPAPHTGYCIAAARHPCEHPAWTYGITTPHAG